MQQQHLMQMQPMMAAYASSNQVTTDVIQQYLDENKQLILAILENQNSGKAEECAENQAKLQRNLMYLAAIADSQPQMPTVAQYPTNTAMQSSGLYMNQQQQHQQMTPQSLMAARSSMLYAQSPMSALTQQQHQHQQSMHGHLSMSSIPTGNPSTGGGGFPILHGEASLRGNGGGGFPDFSRGKQESGGSHSSYLKPSEEEGGNNNNNNN